MILFLLSLSIHVHCKHQNKESRAEIIFENGKFKQLVVQKVKGKDPLNTIDLKKFRKIVEIYRDDIVRKWVDFFLYNKEVFCEKITKKL